MAKKINIFVTLCSLVIFISPLKAPLFNFWVLGFFSYLIPVAMGINALFVLYWLVKISPNIFISIVTLLIGSAFLRSTFSISTGDTQQANLTILNYNVACFNQYPKPTSNDRKLFSQYISTLADANADIITLQEYCNFRKYKGLNVKKHLYELGYKYHASSRNWNKNMEYGQAIFSKFPIKNFEAIPVQNNRDQLFADILVNETVIRVFSVHFNSMRLGLKSNLLKNKKQVSNYMQILKKIPSKLKTGFEKSVYETNHLLLEIKKSPYPVIITGDFNATPYSNTYYCLTRRLNNAFEIAGNGFGSTYDGPIPFLRIDHQFSDGKFEILKSKVICKEGLSDHFPTIVHYKI